MTQDNGLDKPLPVTKQGILEALQVAIELLPRYGDEVWKESPDNAQLDVNFCREYLAGLKANIKADTSW